MRPLEMVNDIVMIAQAILWNCSVRRYYSQFHMTS